MSSLFFACALVSVIAAMSLGTSATARAAADAHVCSVNTLRGLYLWTLDGYQNFGGNPVLKALIEAIRFNGDGTLTIPFGTVNIGGTIVIDVSGSVGTYTVEADYTGTISITDGPSFNIYVGPGAEQLWTTQIAGGCWRRHRTGRGNRDTVP